MTLQEFIRIHRNMIDDTIVRASGNFYINDDGSFSIDDDDREEWIMNDETLYNRAVICCGLEEVLGVTDE